MKNLTRKSNLILLSSSKSGLRFFASSVLALHPWYITGFSDAESSFVVLIDKRGESWVVQVNFAITLHIKDKVLLELVQSYFGGAGNLSQ
jgi:hypothetical protein